MVQSMSGFYKFINLQLYLYLKKYIKSIYVLLKYYVLYNIQHIYIISSNYFFYVTYVKLLTVYLIFLFK